MPPTQFAKQPGADLAALRHSAAHARGCRTAPSLRLAPAPQTANPLLAHLHQQPLFQWLPEQLQQMLASAAQIRRYARDHHVVQQDRLDSNLYLLLRGRAHAERTGPNGRQVLLEVLQPGARIGEMSLLDGEAHNASVRCVLPCDVLVLRGADVLSCQAQSAAFSQAWMADLVGRLRQSNRRIRSMSLDGVRARVLWQLHEWGRADAQGTLVVSSRIGRSELARIVGASREMVCRVLRALQSNGQIELRDDRSIALRPRHAHINSGSDSGTDSGKTCESPERVNARAAPAFTAPSAVP